VDRLAHRPDELLVVVLVQGEEQAFPGGEVLVSDRSRHAGSLGKPHERQSIGPLGADDLERRIEQLPPPLVPTEARRCHGDHYTRRA
jgi:hypothetical protein